MIRNTLISVNAAVAAVNRYTFPASTVTTQVSEHATLTTAQGSSIFVSGGVGYDSVKARPRPCLFYGITVAASITTNPYTIGVIDYAGTVLFQFQMSTAAGGYQLLLPKPVVINPAVGGVGIKTIAADASAKFFFHWNFYS